MKTFTVYYYVVGKTYTEGELPHTIEVEAPLFNGSPLAMIGAMYMAEKTLHELFNKHDQYIFVRVERKNYCYE